MGSQYQPALTGNMSAMTSSGRLVTSGSRNRIDLNAAATGTKVYSNTLYAGDVLAGEDPTCTINSGSQAPLVKQPSSTNMKVMQQRAMSAQKRMDRLQMGGLAQSTVDSSRPGTPGTATAAGAAAGSLSWANSSLGASAPGSPMSLAALSAAPSMSRLTGLAQPTAAAAGSLSKAGSLLGTPPGGTPTASGQRTEAAWPAEGGTSTSASTAGRALVARGLATSYDPSEDPTASSATAATPSTIAATSSTSSPQQQAATAANAAIIGVLSTPGATVKSVKPDMSNMLAFLTQPGPRGGHVLCYIQREKSIKGNSYQLFFEASHTFLLSARQVKKASGSSYAISSTPEPAAKGSKELMAKLRSNFIGTEFTIVDGGRKPGKEEQAAVVGDAPLCKELAAVTFQHNVLGTRGPRKMNAVVPNPSKQLDSKGPSCLERLQTGNGIGKEVLLLRNKAPKWNDALGAYCLNFNKRVTEASVKNFQLVVDTDEEQVVLQFGKVGDTVFTCDFMWPLTPLQAFAICLSSFDNKLACE